MVPFACIHILFVLHMNACKRDHNKDRFSNRTEQKFGRTVERLFSFLRVLGCIQATTFIASNSLFHRQFRSLWSPPGQPARDARARQPVEPRDNPARPRTVPEPQEQLSTELLRAVDVGAQPRRARHQVSLEGAQRWRPCRAFRVHGDGEIVGVDNCRDRPPREDGCWGGRDQARGWEVSASNLSCESHVRFTSPRSQKIPSAMLTLHPTKLLQSSKFLRNRLFLALRLPLRHF